MNNFYKNQKASDIVWSKFPLETALDKALINLIFSL